MDRAPYFINLREAPKIEQIEGLDTTILTGLHGEKMMMVLNATLPGHKVPLHSHPHEQVGMVYSGKAVLKIGDEECIVKKGDFYCIPARAAQRHMHWRRAVCHARHLLSCARRFYSKTAKNRYLSSNNLRAHVSIIQTTLVHVCLLLL